MIINVIDEEGNLKAEKVYDIEVNDAIIDLIHNVDIVIGDDIHIREY